MADGASQEQSPSRPRLQLKPRDEAAAKKIEAERQASIGKSPFGSAKPRERVIAEREGKDENEILQEEVKKEKLRLRLNANQLEEKKSHEAAVKEIEDQIEAEEDAGKQDVLKVELAARQAKLDALVDRFAKATLETALSGEAPRVSQMRRIQAEATQVPYGAPTNAIPPPISQGPPGQYNPRYNPTQQYAGPGQYNGAPRGGGRGFSNYNPRGGGHRGGYRGGRGGAAGPGGAWPEWAQEEYVLPGGPPPSRGFERAGSGSAGAYGDSSDVGFYDQPVGGAAYGGGGRGGGGGGGRGRGRGRGGYYDGGNGGGYYGGGSGRGVGGEIQFDAFSGQDRY